MGNHGPSSICHLNCTWMIYVKETVFYTNNNFSPFAPDETPIGLFDGNAMGSTRLKSPVTGQSGNWNDVVCLTIGIVTVQVVPQTGQVNLKGMMPSTFISTLKLEFPMRTYKKAIFSIQQTFYPCTLTSEICALIVACTKYILNLIVM